MNEHTNTAPRRAPYPPIRRTDASGRFKPDGNNEYVGVQIRTGRRLMGLSRSVMAEQIGADYTMLTAYEHGVRATPPMMMARIADVLEKPLFWFYQRQQADAANRQPAPAAASRSAAPVAERPRVLLVDDAPDVLVTLGAFLEGAGLHVIKASSGDEALRIVAGPEVLHAIVTDNTMPGLSGTDLLLQSALIRPNVPGLIVTGSTDARNLGELPKTVGILSKPFRREELVQRLRQLTAAPPLPATFQYSDSIDAAEDD
jgi:CheY-like chemotaxis protein